VRNAFRPQTVIELSDAFTRAREDTEVGVIILTGEGPDAFCSGGDQRVRTDSGYLDDPGSPGGHGRFHVTDLHVQIRRTPKPVIAMVAGYADRRRQRLAGRLRSHDRSRKRPFWSDRAARRLVRWRLRREHSCSAGGAEAREGDLVPLPPVRRPSRRWPWAS